MILEDLLHHLFGVSLTTLSLFFCLPVFFPPSLSLSLSLSLSVASSPLPATPATYLFLFATIFLSFFGLFFMDFHYWVDNFLFSRQKHRYLSIILNKPLSLSLSLSLFFLRILILSMVIATRVYALNLEYINFILGGVKL